MANLTKSKTLFGITSPRTLEKIIPEIKLLLQLFEGKSWTGNQELQSHFFESLFKTDFYEGKSYPSDPALAARDRITRAPKALGFIDLKPKIELTKSGKALIEGKRINEIFTRQLLKFQLPSPYHTQSIKIEFNVKPYLELLRLINDLESLSKTEIALFFLQLTNLDKYELILNKIKRFRNQSKHFKGTRKTYVHQCFKSEVIQIFKEDIHKKNFKTRETDDATLKKFIATKRRNMKDYADAFSRYIRATGLVTIQKKTFRLIISSQKKEEVSFLLKKTKRNPIQFKDLKEFKKYLFIHDNINLFSDNKRRLTSKLRRLGYKIEGKRITLEKLKDMLENAERKLKRNNIKEERKVLKTYKRFPQILHVFKQIEAKEIPDPSLFLEWNVWRAFEMLNYAKKINGNFSIDLEGMPLHYAPGGFADIEAEYDDFNLIIEVTMSTGHTQYKMENESVPRHFGKLKSRKKDCDMYCIFIAPKISEGTLAHYFNLNRMETKLYGGKTKIIPLSIELFVQFIEIGVKDKFNNPKKLQSWLENIWEFNQSCNDETLWYDQIGQNIKNWVV
ncbi:MAG: AlwI family type II restriction endonuclease [Verrucomicrobiota bacterium]|nr:AlwI family type II restriction endonuclease [Verrucomicrobiota bacterium]